MRTRRIHRRLRVEELEPRIAPTGIWDYWVEMGAHSATNGGISNNTGSSDSASIATDTAGNPVVAWSDDQSGDTEVYLLRWNGSAWAALGGSTSGGGISNAPDPSTVPAIAIGTDGGPIVAWRQYSDASQNVYVRRWDGSSWAEMGAGSASGGGLSNGGASNWGQSPDIAAATNGNVCVAWRQYASAG